LFGDQSLEDKLRQLVASPAWKDHSISADGYTGMREIVVRRFITAANQLARSQLLKEYPDLKKKLDAQLQKAIQARRPDPIKQLEVLGQ
jgi:hypothetical protein